MVLSRLLPNVLYPREPGWLNDCGGLRDIVRGATLATVFLNTLDGESGEDKASIFVPD